MANERIKPFVILVDSHFGRVRRIDLVRLLILGQSGVDPGVFRIVI